MSLKPVEDKTRLWHLRLGHISEKGLRELEKKSGFGTDKIENLEFCEDCSREVFKGQLQEIKSEIK